MRIAREEIFGPVAAVIKVKDYLEALASANNSAFGLSAGIVTISLKHATHFKRNVEAGMVTVNVPTAGVDFHVPFGGRKGSSYGQSEQGKYAAEFITVVKTAYTAFLRPRSAYSLPLAKSCQAGYGPAGGATEESCAAGGQFSRGCTAPAD